MGLRAHMIEGVHLDENGPLGILKKRLYRFGGLACQKT